MKKTKKRNRIIVTLLLTIFCISGLQVNSKTIRSLDFLKDKCLPVVYPGKYKSLQKLAGTGKARHLVISRTEEVKGALCTYMTFRLPPSAAKMIIKVKYQTVFPAKSNGKILLRLNYNDKSRRNGSAGRKQLALPQSSKWLTKIVTFDNVPKKAVSCQLVFFLNGGPCSLKIRSVRVMTGSDSIPVKKAATGFKSMLSPTSPAWKGITLLNDFYEMESAKAARVQTKVKLTYDDKNLYVGFIAYEPKMASLRAVVNKRDGRVWSDDSVQFFIFDKLKDKGWQFILNSNGAKADYVLLQRNPGDPYKASIKWNGSWNAAAFRKKNSWEATFIIPWETIGFTDLNSGSLSLNFARERKLIPENSHWNAYQGKFTDIAKYAVMSFKNNKAVIRRFRQKSDVKYTIKRPQVKLSEISLNEPGNYILGVWNAGAWRGDYPRAMVKKNAGADFDKWRQELFSAWGESGMFGPDLRRILMYNKVSTMREFNKRYGMKCPYYMSSWNLVPYIDYLKGKLYVKTRKGKRFDVASPISRKALLGRIANLKNPKLSVFRQYNDKDFMKNKDLVLYWQGFDEPTNILMQVYSRSINKDITAALDKVDEEIKQSKGFGKYGLPDYYKKPDKDTPFRRIAFRRWWNSNYSAMLKESQAALKKVDPAIPYMGIDVNTTAGMSGMVDLTEMTEFTDWVGCDPYPTAAAANYGMSRALFHTGFNVKLIADLAAKSRPVAIPQAFIFHGGRPKPAEMREWASQSLKNGAEIVYWYAYKAPMLDVPDVYREMLRINKFISKMKKLRIPKETKSAILYSDYDYWGLADVSQHAMYSVYSVLGEHVKAWFKFISPPGVNRGLFKLSDYRVIYIPRLRYTDAKFSESLIKYVKEGGKLVVFDPQALSYNIDGTVPVKEHNELFGTSMKPKKYSGYLVYKEQHLPVSKIMNLNIPEAGSVAAWDFGKLPKGAKVIVKYSDGKAAAIERKIGKGSIISFAVMPFGDSEVAISPKGWKTFFSDISKQAGEKTALPIWDLLLPKIAKDSIKLNFTLNK